MQAIEFITDAEDGIIRIPKKYLKDLKKNIRVIILVEEKEKKAKSFPKKGLTILKIKTKGLSYDRDEANTKNSH